MDNNQHLTNFDAMLKQSLEGSQMPVPTGVWEAVGSSIGAKAIVATKIASLKLLILKTVAGLVLAGGVGFGIYKVLNDKSETISSVNLNTIKKDLVENNLNISILVQPEIETSQKIVSVSKSFVINEDSMFVIVKPETKVDEIVQETRPEVIVKEEKPAVEKHNQIIEESTQNQIEPKKLTETKAPTTEITPVPAFPEPPNVFTPNDDGINDCFKIEIENEKMFFLQIFNAQGKKVFETTDKNISWCGININNGELCPKGLYTYKLIYELTSGFKKKESRWLTLL